MRLSKNSPMSGTTMCGHIHIMVTKLHSKPGQESVLIKAQVLQKCLTTTNHDDLQAYAKENLSMEGSPLKKEKKE